MVTIKYNNINPFDGISQTPLVSRRENYIRSNSTMYREDILTLRGKIKRPTCTNSFSDIYDLVTRLVKNFADNFKKFEIIENGITIFSYNTAIVQSIEIDEDKYFDMVPYTITIKCIKDGFGEIYGITNPVDSYEFVEEEGCIVSITHRVSCSGIQNSNDAITNAKNFINSRRGFKLSYSPVGYTVSNPVLVSQNENIANYNAEISLTETYLFDKSNLSGNSQIIQKSIVEITLNDGIANVTVSGSYQGSFGSTINQIRTAVNIPNLYALAYTDYLVYNSSGGLNINPISMNIDESIDEKIINFSVVFSDGSTIDPYVIDSTRISTSGISSCIECKLIIKSDYGCPSERLRKTTNYFQALDLQSYVASKWSTFGNGGYIGNIPKSKSIDTDVVTGTISVTIVYCDNNYESCNCLENLSYKLSFLEAIPKFSETASLAGEGCYYIQDLNYITRAKFSIDGRATPSKCCNRELIRSSVISRANQLMAEYFDASDIILEECNIEISSDMKIVGFNVSWNGEKSSRIDESIIYGNITKSTFIVENDVISNIII